MWLLDGAIVLLLASALEFGRRVLFGHLLYEMNRREDAPLHSLPPPAAGQKTLLFAPHEDDETLGAGGYLQRAVAAGAPVHVALMSNGEYPELSVILFEETVRLTPEKFIQLGIMRQRETLNSLRFLGLPPGVVTFLGYPNQYLNLMWLPDHWLPDRPVESRRTRATRSPYADSLTPEAIYCGESVLRDVQVMLLREKPAVVLTVHSNDLHVDHWPTGAFVRFALAELAARGEAFARDARIYVYLIHRDHWPVPRRYRPALPLEPPAALVDADHTVWQALPLTLLQTRRKRNAIGLYRSQGGHYDPLLQSFARANDLFGVERVQEWPATGDVARRPILAAPVEDLDSAAAHPAGDIRRVSLGRRGECLVVALALHGVPGSDITYHVSVHAGGAAPATSMFGNALPDIPELRVLAPVRISGDDCLLPTANCRLPTADCYWRTGSSTSTQSLPRPLEGGVNSRGPALAKRSAGSQAPERGSNQQALISGPDSRPISTVTGLPVGR